MDYMEVKCKVEPAQPGYDILMAEMAELNYDSFVENEDNLLAYIPLESFQKGLLNNLHILSLDDFSIDFEFKEIKAQNWNAKWEEDYQPVLIENSVNIRAPFHQKLDVDFDIIIEPKMSFGTAHHATTAQMVQLILEKDVEGMDVLDMGSGTAVLAILASKKGAKHVDAIDNDEWAYNNAVENIERNAAHNVSAFLGDAELLAGKKYDLIIANINRNILLNDLKAYAKSLKSNCNLFMSGFYEEDIEILKKEAIKYGISYVSHRVKDEWVASVWIME